MWYGLLTALWNDCEARVDCFTLAPAHRDDLVSWTLQSVRRLLVYQLTWFKPSSPVAMMHVTVRLKHRRTIAKPASEICRHVVSRKTMYSLVSQPRAALLILSALCPSRVSSRLLR